MKDVSGYATREISPTMEAFADYLIAEVYGGTLPEGIDEVAFRKGVALGGSTRNYFQASERWKNDPRNYLANVEANRATKAAERAERAKIAAAKAAERERKAIEALETAVEAARAKALAALSDAERAEIEDVAPNVESAPESPESAPESPESAPESGTRRSRRAA